MKKHVFAIAMMLLMGVGAGFAQEAKVKLTPEQQLTQEYFTLAFQKKDTAAAAKVKAKLLKKYPRGKFARREMAEHLNMSNPEAYIKEAEAFRKAFPISEYIAHPDDQGYVYVNFYNAYSRFLYKQKMYDRLEEVMKEMSFDMLVDLYRHTVMFNIMKAPIDPGSYVDIAEKMTREMIAKAPERYDFYGDGKKVDASQQLKDLNHYLAVETEILQRSGRNGDAVNCLNRIANPQVRYNQYPQGNEAYVKALVALGRNDEAVKGMEGAASTGLMTKNLTAMLRAHYDNANPKPAATWDAYLNSLKSPAYLENLKADVMRGMVDEPYMPWTMKSIKDTEVSSASFGKDDIIVLDFWATWCAPCIAALEGMQMAVNKYKNDPHVHFYFVDTQDVPGDKQGPTRVWKRKGYSFDDMLVLFDNATPGKKDMNLVYKTMFHGTSGIPQKAILKNGRLRYRAEGYGGSPSGLEDEIAAVIDILKAEGNE